MSEHENEPGVPDEALPEDLVPADDNPLAEGLDDGETVEGLLDGGKQADQSSEESEESQDE
ncbi:hypothetical protein [Nocardioides lianchengensis]|uniref:Uncharacterized protein n=1 Tax=Nocardioides lianchengensis TaxID=1045774 RepID=A0A1G6WY78_9ACTN|nr:hypothetical protein [Nocardioides lianchengensis]NYG09183.1 hypothetical protein [Nocardioides lianchengensis]SDD69955.1 hypothetical protein SAMN05421872_11075 [Nocardioides lianchengensis]